MPRSRPTVPVLIQSQYRGQAWPVLLCGLLAQQTRGAAAAPVVASILDRWPTWESAHAAIGPHITEAGHIDVAPGGGDTAWRWLFDELQPLGLQNRRIATLMKWLVAFKAKGLPRTRADVESLPGAGDYVADGFELFVEERINETPPKSEDGPLTQYWKAQRARRKRST